MTALPFAVWVPHCLWELGGLKSLKCAGDWLEDERGDWLEDERGVGLGCQVMGGRRV